MTEQQQRLIELGAKIVGLDCFEAYGAYYVRVGLKGDGVIWNPLTDHNQFAECQDNAAREGYEWSLSQRNHGACCYAWIANEDGDFIRDNEETLDEPYDSRNLAWFLAMEQVWVPS